ncbi:MAG: substrate-binding domain-containing protein [Ectothiorhodospiraceae bacterium AqS1]|nr:substrate-binding domain-containing protein [Ectothiorhodospiraceae bacterium AqS1]
MKRSLALALAWVVFVPASALARDQISIVGSSTVYPFATVVAEQFGRISQFKTPTIESTGSGGGLKLFCAGIGIKYPDITNASRRIKSSEIERCAKNGVEEIVEVKIGFDGIVLANSRKAPRADFSLRQIFLALAKQVPNPKGGNKLVPNPYQKWSDVDPSLPDIDIEVMGPPPTSGTRDAFTELAMEGGCKTFEFIEKMKESKGKRYKAICHGVREDGAYIEAGENDNLIVQKLDANPDAFGIFGYSFLEQNANLVHGSLIDGTTPDFENISDQSYPVSRALYFYVKKAHVGTIPGLKDFLAEFTNDKAWGPYGYLADKGLIPLLDDERAKFADDVKKLSNLSL